MRAEIGMVEEIPGRAGHDGRGDNAVRDTTLVTSDEGPIIMNAVRDEDGNMVATDVLEAASVTARFRNVAERGGMCQSLCQNVPIFPSISAPISFPSWESLYGLLNCDTFVIRGTGSPDASCAWAFAVMMPATKASKQRNCVFNILILHILVQRYVFCNENGLKSMENRVVETYFNYNLNVKPAFPVIHYIIWLMKQH